MKRIINVPQSLISYSLVCIDIFIGSGACQQATYTFSGTPGKFVVSINNKSVTVNYFLNGEMMSPGMQVVPVRGEPATRNGQKKAGHLIQRPNGTWYLIKYRSQKMPEYIFHLIERKLLEAKDYNDPIYIVGE